MRKTIWLKVPWGEPPIRLVRMKVTPITLKGFEQFAFCLHRPLRYGPTLKPVVAKCGWMVATVPTGFRVTHAGRTQADAISLALQRLRKAGKARTAKAIREGAKLIQAAGL